MRKELPKKESKFKHYILTPIRILKKAKELYVKGVVDCAGAASSAHISHHPQRELLRSTVPIKNVNVGNNQTRLVTQKGERVPPIRNVGNETHKRMVGYKYNRMKMSYHTEVRKMGTIDEDKPCYFEEDQNSSNSKVNLLYLYPRSRVCAVERRALY